MKIEGNIIKVKGDYVYIKQFWSGYIYKTTKEFVRVRGTPTNPERVNGKLVGIIDGIGCSRVMAQLMPSNYIK